MLLATPLVIVGSINTTPTGLNFNFLILGFQVFQTLANYSTDLLIPGSYRPLLVVKLSLLLALSTHVPRLFRNYTHEIS
jgi:hypothetical protein